MAYWLMKSEPTTFGIEDLANLPKQTDFWEGVRNYQARNFMRDDMKLGDLAFLYHSSCPVPGIAGTMTVVKESQPDVTALDPKSPYYDPKSTEDNPRWFGVRVQLRETFDDLIRLSDIKTNPKLSEFKLIKPGNRLSILPVTAKEWAELMKMRPEA